MTTMSSVNIGRKPSVITLTDGAIAKVTDLLAQEGNDALGPARGGPARWAARGTATRCSSTPSCPTTTSCHQPGCGQGRRRPGQRRAAEGREPRVHRRLAGRRVQHLEPQRHPHLRVRFVLQLTHPGAPDSAPTLSLRVDGVDVEVPDDGASLLEVLRQHLGRRSPKDGCSPQGQCGCCTVWVDGAPRVACVTPARRVAGREVTTLEGLDPEVREAWAEAFTTVGASQCGFCTPGIIMRLAALGARHEAPDDEAVERALLAHLCRCTGWRTILEAARQVYDGPGAPPSTPRHRGPRDLDAAARRAGLEGGGLQAVGAGVACGGGGFAEDTAPADALVAVPDGRGGWAVGASLEEARSLARGVPGRNSTVALRHPLEVPPGEWDLTLRTTFVEPAYLEPDASWCVPGGEPVTPLANGGAFGGKVGSPVRAAARRLADEAGRPVRVVFSREDVVRYGPKRPPVAAGVRADGSGVIRVARTPGSVGPRPMGAGRRGGRPGPGGGRGRRGGAAGLGRPARRGLGRSRRPGRRPRGDPHRPDRTRSPRHDAVTGGGCCHRHHHRGGDGAGVGGGGRASRRRGAAVVRGGCCAPGARMGPERGGGGGRGRHRPRPDHQVVRDPGGARHAQRRGRGGGRSSARSGGGGYRLRCCRRRGLGGGRAAVVVARGQRRSCGERWSGGERCRDGLVGRGGKA